MKKRISIVLVMVMMLLLAACSSGGDTLSTTEILSGVGQGNNGDITVDISYDDGKVTKISIEKHIETEADVVVIGAGGAGMSAAVKLKEAGKNVVLLEKQEITGGATNLAATYFVAVETKAQIEAGETTTKEEYIESLIEDNPKINKGNATTLFERSQKNIDWLIDKGVDLTKSMSHYQVGIADGSSLGISITGALNKEVENLGVDLRLQNEATEIIMADGKVSGVKVSTQGGSYTISTEHVVITTGGFASSEEMVEKYAPAWKGAVSTSASGSTGDGTKLALGAGGSLGDMDIVRMNPSVYSEGNISASVSVCRAGGGIMVNTEGNRFCDDYFPDYTQLSKWIMEQPGDHVFVVFDQKVVDDSKRVQEFKENGFFLEGETIEELAEKMGVPSHSLEATMQDYKKVFDSGIDEKFGRTVAINSALDQGPYYAVKSQPGIQVTLGGINVNEGMEVVAENGTVVPGLYAAGECANDGLYGSAPVNINMTFGNVVAENILSKFGK